MELNEYSKDDLIKLARKLQREKKYLDKKQEITEKIGDLKGPMTANRLGGVFLRF